MSLPETSVSIELVLFLAAIVLGLFLIGRMNEQFCISIRNGRVLVVRGRVPKSFLADVRELTKSPPVRRATIRGIREATRTRLAFAGLDDRRVQRLTNTFAIYPQSKIRAAQPVAHPTLGQVLGIVWLAWLLDRDGRS